MGSGLFFFILFFYNKMQSNRAAEEISATPEDDDYHNNVDDVNVKVMSILINYLCFNFLVSEGWLEVRPCYAHNK